MDFSMIKTSLMLTAITMCAVGTIIAKRRLDKLEKRIKQLDNDVEKLIQNDSIMLTNSKKDDIINGWR